MRRKVFGIIEAFRPNQWIKNLAIFASVILNGMLYDQELSIKSVLAYVVFCCLSSSSYLVNDLVDVDKDRKHPTKKNRPIARGDVSRRTAIFFVFFLVFVGLGLAQKIGFSFLLISIAFIVLQYSYSFILKTKALFDIIGIATSFIIRAYAGEIATGYHLPVWMMLSVIFLALFVASGKRRSELVNVGRHTRQALSGYTKSLLNFYSSIFAVLTLMSYAMFTFFEEPIRFDGIFHQYLSGNASWALDRKWYMITLFPIIFGIMRYGQIIFEMQEGERPERIVTTDIPLMISIVSWGMLMITIIYVL